MLCLQIFGGSSILGEGKLGELSSAILVDGVEAIAGWVTVFIVDRVGRRVLLIPGCGMGAATLIAAGIVLKYETIGRLTLATGSAAVTVILVIRCPCSPPQVHLFFPPLPICVPGADVVMQHLRLCMECVNAGSIFLRKMVHPSVHSINKTVQSLHQNFCDQGRLCKSRCCATAFATVFNNLSSVAG